MKKLYLILTILFLSSTAHAITFTPNNISIERPSIKYIYTAKTWFFGYIVNIVSSQPGKYVQLTSDLANWRKNHSSVRDGSPTDILISDVILDSGYVTGWENNGKYDIVTSSMSGMSLIEQNNIISKVNSLLPECKVFRSGSNYVDYKCN